MSTMVQLEVELKSRKAGDVTRLTIGQLAERAGVATSAIRFYEARGLIQSRRTTGNQRRYEQAELRRVAFIRTAQRVGLSLDEIGEALATLPENRAPTKADWTRLSRAWRPRLDEQIRADRAAARPARRLHRLRLPEPAELRAAQPRRRGRPRAGPGAVFLEPSGGTCRGHGAADRGEPPGSGDRDPALVHPAGGVDRRARRTAAAGALAARRPDRAARPARLRRQGDRRGARLPGVPPAPRPAADGTARGGAAGRGHRPRRQGRRGAAGRAAHPAPAVLAALPQPVLSTGSPPTTCPR